MAKFQIGAVVLIVFIIGLMCLTFNSMNHMSHRSNVKSACYYYTLNGAPTEIIIDDITYKVQENGKIGGVDLAMMNPYHRQRVAYEGCVQINVKGKDWIERKNK